MEERMNAVQEENSNLLEILDEMQEKIKVLENKLAIPASVDHAPRVLGKKNPQQNFFGN
jgi:predicted RNase H-like nuclease (RuvC/YqgF family)